MEWLKRLFTETEEEKRIYQKKHTKKGANHRNNPAGTGGFARQVTRKRARMGL